MTVSVIVPAYNGERYLAEALQSIVTQTRRASEILLVDDGSVDNTAAIALSYAGQGVQYCRQEHGGFAAAINHGLRMTFGDIVAFLDADDLWAEKKLELQMAYLESSPAEIVLGHQQRMWQRPGCPEWSYTPPELGLALTAVTVRRSTFEKTGIFDPEMSQGADWDWFFRARERGARFLTHPETVLFYRRHETNMTLDLEGGKKSTLNLLKRSLDRRRALTGRAESLPVLKLPAQS